MATHRTVVEDGCRIFDLEAEVERYAEENLKLKKQVIELTDKEESASKMQSKYGKLKEEYECAESRWKEEKKGLTDKCWESEMVAKRLRLDVGIMALGLKAAEDEARRVESLMEEKQDTVLALLYKIQALEKVEVEIRDLKSKLEIACVVNRAREAKNQILEEVRVLELMREIEVLESYKGDMDDEICELKRNLEDRDTEIGKLRSRLPEVDCEADYLRVISELGRKIDVLEMEKEGMAAENCKLRQAVEVKSEEILRISVDKMGLELEKWDVNDVSEEMNVALTNRISILETRILELEAEITEKNGVIKKLVLENGYSMTVDKEVSTPSQNEGHSNEHSKSIDHDAGTCKRKRPSSECDELSQKYVRPESEHVSRSVGGSEVQVVCEWNSDQDLLDAFDVDQELCLKAVCALYKQHKRLSDSTNSHESRVFKSDYSLKAITLGEFLIAYEPENSRMKKLVGKLNKIDVKAVDECMNIAKQHYKQVFEICKKKEDPLFFS